MTQSSHAVVQASETPTPAQLKELFAQIETGRVTKDTLQKFLRGTPQSQAFSFAGVKPPYVPYVEEYLTDWFQYWDKKFPGAGAWIVSKLQDDFLDPDFWFHLRSEKRYWSNPETGEEDLESLWRRSFGIQGFRVITTDHVKKYFRGLEYLQIARYSSDYFEDKINGYERFFPGIEQDNLYDQLLAATHDFMDTVPEGKKSFEERFIEDFSRDIRGSLAECLLYDYAGVLLDNLKTCVMLAVASAFMDPYSGFDLIRFLDPWLFGNYPIGLDQNLQLLVLCAP